MALLWTCAGVRRGVYHDVPELIASIEHFIDVRVRRTLRRAQHNPGAHRLLLSTRSPLHIQAT